MVLDTGLQTPDVMLLVELECLRRLRELRADYNVIRDFTGLKKLENLKKLSLTHNKIEEVDLECCRWWVRWCSERQFSSLTIG